jgi:transcription initiation factor TFIID subunit 13
VNDILPAMSAQCTGQRGSLKLRLRMPPPPNINLTPVSTPPAVRCPLLTTSTALSRSAPVYIPGEFSPSWPHNPQDTNLLRAGYQPGWKSKDTPTPIPATLKSGRLAPPPGMAEPRARAARHKGQMNFSSERKSSLNLELQVYPNLKHETLTLLSSTTTPSRLR